MSFFPLRGMQACLRQVNFIISRDLWSAESVETRVNYHSLSTYPLKLLNGWKNVMIRSSLTLCSTFFFPSKAHTPSLFLSLNQRQWKQETTDVYSFLLLCLLLYVMTGCLVAGWNKCFSVSLFHPWDFCGCIALSPRLAKLVAQLQ